MAAGPPGAAASAGLFLVPQAQVATDALAWLCRTSASDWSDWPCGESDRQRPSAASPRRAQAHGGRGAAPGQSPSEGKACELEPKPVPAQTGQGLRQPPCAWPPALPPTRSAARSSLQDETTRPWRETMETMSRFAKNKVLGRGTAAASSRETQTQRDRERQTDREVGAPRTPALLRPTSHGAWALARTASDHPVAAPWSALNRAHRGGARPAPAPPSLLSHWLAGHLGHRSGRPPSVPKGGKASCAERPPPGAGLPRGHPGAGPTRPRPVWPGPCQLAARPRRPSAPWEPSVLGQCRWESRACPSKTTAGLTVLSTGNGHSCLGSSSFCPCSLRKGDTTEGQPRAALMEDTEPGRAQGTLGARWGPAQVGRGDPGATAHWPWDAAVTQQAGVAVGSVRVRQ